MEVVGSHLRAYTMTLHGTGDADLFGRSSFNRYYYATYLAVRKELLALLPDAPTQHATVPDYLRGSIQQRIRAIKTKAKRAGDPRLMQSCSVAKVAAEELASLLFKGYKTRVVADYEPDVSVQFATSSHEFSLDTVSSSEAQSWPHRARYLMRSISEVLRSAE